MRTQTAQAVRDLWNEITQSKRVVIFCGAGVTIGRTGVSWGELVRQVARKTLCTEKDELNFCEACEKFFGSTNFSAEQKASVAAAKVLHDTTINEVIAETLYTNSGYQEGRLLNALTNLMMEMLIEHKDIDIVTTNYDTYIEDGILSLIKAYKNNEMIELPEEQCPRMNVIIFKDDGSEEEIPIHDGGVAQSILCTSTAELMTRERRRELWSFLRGITRRATIGRPKSSCSYSRIPRRLLWEVAWSIHLLSGACWDSRVRSQKGVAWTTTATRSWQGCSKTIRPRTSCRSCVLSSSGSSRCFTTITMRFQTSFGIFTLSSLRVWRTLRNIYLASLLRMTG